MRMEIIQTGGDRLHRNRICHDASAALHTRSDDVQNLGQTPSAAADQGDIEMGKPFQRSGSRPLDHCEVLCGKTCRILLDEGDSLGILFDGVDMPLRCKTRRRH